MTTEIGRLGVWTWLDGFSAPEAADFANQIEEWGYSALWIPEAVGRDQFRCFADMPQTRPGRVR